MRAYRRRVSGHECSIAGEIGGEMRRRYLGEEDYVPHPIEISMESALCLITLRLTEPCPGPLGRTALLPPNASSANKPFVKSDNYYFQS